MQHVLEGKSFAWVSLDAVGVFTAATRKMLNDHFADQAIKVHLIRADLSDDLSAVLQRQVTGLVTIVLQHESEVPSACRALWRVRGRLEQPICACYISHDLVDSVPVLLEAGAQTVVSKIDIWQRALPQIIARAPLSKQGFHPLTAGLIDRLPWKEQS